MKLAWKQRAVADRDAIFNQLAADNAAAAIELDELFSRRVGELTLHPHMYGSGPATCTRKMMVDSQFVVVYRIGTDVVEILRIAHSSRRWP